jgi:hypothetical protein
VPGSGGSPLPALEAVAAYLREADRDALPLAERAIDVVRRYHDPPPSRRWAATPPWTRPPSAWAVATSVPRAGRVMLKASRVWPTRRRAPGARTAFSYARVGSSGHGGS